MYAITVATNNNPLNWDNVAPRSAEHKAKVKETLSEEAYGRYERAEGASANTIESLPLFASAVIVGNAAGLKRDGWFGLNAIVGAWFAIRTFYTISYIVASTKGAARAKTGFWFTSLANFQRLRQGCKSFESIGNLDGRRERIHLELCKSVAIFLMKICSFWSYCRFDTIYTNTV